MSPEPQIHKINFNALDTFPMFIDYDMENMKCRGMSAKIDLFSYGALSREIEKLKGEGLQFAKEEGIFIRKNKFLFDCGFFLFDFGWLLKEPEKFASKVKEMALETVYIENSKHFQMEGVVSVLRFCSAQLLEFDDATHS